jgi:hypothetical protein
LRAGLKKRIKPVLGKRTYNALCAKELSKMARCYWLNLSMETRQRKDALEVLPVFTFENKSML